MSFDTPIFIVLHVAAFAFFVSLAVSGYMVYAGFLDSPNQRSNHSKPVPTAGGVGIVVGCGAGLMALALFYPTFGSLNPLGAVMAVSLGVAFLGLFDDIYEINPKLKFVVILALAIISVYVVGPPKLLLLAETGAGGSVPLPTWLGFSGAVLWVFVMTNATNFMDGSNGMMAVSMAISFTMLNAIALLFNASNTAVFSGVMAAALVGFAAYNAGNRTRIFSGDVGALFVGFSFAVCALMLVGETPYYGLIYVGPLLALPFLTDVLLTMFLRATRRENLLRAHNSHLYQRMLKAGYSHVTVSVLYGLAAWLMGIITVVSLWFGSARSLVFLALCTSFCTGLYVLINRKLKANLPVKPQNRQDV